MYLNVTLTVIKMQNINAKNEIIMQKITLKIMRKKQNNSNAWERGEVVEERW